MGPREPNPYYRCRQSPPSADFGENYWGVVVDPDGVRRDMRTERERVLEDIKDELAFLNGLEPGRILDVGCGLGYLLSALDKRWEKHGVELSSFAARLAMREGKIHTGDLRSADYPDAFFDVVSLYHVIEHMTDPCREIAEVRRVLKPGGQLLIASPDFDSACARRFGDKFRLLHDQTHISLFSRDSLRRFLEDHGFVVDRIELPFFETRYFTQRNLERLFDTTQISPPFHGNIMTFYARRPTRPAAVDALANASRLAARVALEQETQMQSAIALLHEVGSRGGSIVVVGDGADEHAHHMQAAGYRALPLVEFSPCSELRHTLDMLFVIAVHELPLQCIRQAQLRGIPVIALAGPGTPGIKADVLLVIPSENARDVELAQSFITTALCHGLPGLDSADGSLV